MAQNNPVTQTPATLDNFIEAVEHHLATLKMVSASMKLKKVKKLDIKDDSKRRSCLEGIQRYAAVAAEAWHTQQQEAGHYGK